MAVSQVGAFLRANVAILVLGLLVGLVVGWVTASFTTAQYSATARILPAVGGGSNDPGGFSQTTFMQSRIPEYVAFGSTDSFLERVISENRLGMRRGDLERELDLSSPKESSLIDVTVRSPSARAAADRANATAGVLAVVIPEREQLLPVHVTVIETAQVPSAPSGATRTATMAMYGIIGLTGGFMVSLLRSLPRSTRSVRA